MERIEDGASERMTSLNKDIFLEGVWVAEELVGVSDALKKEWQGIETQGWTVRAPKQRQKDTRERRASKQTRGGGREKGTRDLGREWVFEALRAAVPGILQEQEGRTRERGGGVRRCWHRRESRGQYGRGRGVIGRGGQGSARR